MIAVSESLLRPAFLFAGAAVFAAGVLSVYVLSMPMAPDRRTVVKVCRDGTLVLRTRDGDFEVLRRGALQGWRAVGPEVCQ